MFDNIDKAIEYCELKYNQLKDTCPECALEHNQLKEWLLDYKNLKSKETYYGCIERILGSIQESFLTKKDIEDLLNEDYYDLTDDIKEDLIKLKEKIEKENITK